MKSNRRKSLVHLKKYASHGVTQRHPVSRCVIISLQFCHICITLVHRSFIVMLKVLHRRRTFRVTAASQFHYSGILAASQLHFSFFTVAPQLYCNCNTLISHCNCSYASQLHCSWVTAALQIHSCARKWRHIYPFYHKQRYFIIHSRHLWCAFSAIEESFKPQTYI